MDPPSSECLVCGSQDLSLGISPTNRSQTPVTTKLREVLLDAWVPGRGESAVCCTCFHLVDRFDTLQGQLEAIRRDLTDKYVARAGNNVAVKKCRPYNRRKKPPEDPDGYVPPDNVMPDVETRAIYDTDPRWLSPGERLRVGLETSPASFACVHCDHVAPSEDCLTSHVHSDHLPTFLTAPLPPSLGLGAASNCGVQLSNVSTEKPFACIFCDAAFKFKSNLSVHFKEKHTPHKPFSCVDCSDRFRRSMELSRHKVYYCPYRKKNLTRKEKKTK